MSSACKRKLEVVDDMLDSVKESLAEVTDNDKKDEGKKYAFGVLSGSILKKYGRNRLGKYFNVSYKKRRLQSEWWQKK